MSEYDPNCSSPKRGGNPQNQLNTSSENLDDTVGGASNNNSIIGKVKSRVSSILPTSFSKWFSPSNKNCDSVNGSFISSGTARRRRHVEIEDDDDFDYENGEREDRIVAHQDDYNESVLVTQQNVNYDEDSNQSEEESSTYRNSNRRPQLKSATAARQPPNKRLRYTFDVTNTRDSPLAHSPSIVSSTPAIGDGLHIGTAKSSILTRAQNRFAHSNSYESKSKKEPDPHLSPSTSREPNTDEVIDLVTLQECAIVAPSNDTQSRRSLNIPTQNASDRLASLSNLKRQTLSTFRNEIPNTSLGIEHDSCLRSVIPGRTSTTIVEHEPESDTLEEETEEICDDATIEQHVLNYNGSSSTFNNKRQMLTNGEGTFYEPGIRTAARRGSTSESSEGGRESRTENNAKRPRKIGLFNSSSMNSRNGSRTSSFGNGLNFYSHLDGRKSLFSGVHGMPGTINNSTLSLNCYNRRQFNASIYGSTSALSDSRLLDTFSPFYKGKTTYGGASAYNKHKAGVGTGAGASSVRITPTLIRPTSSLSTLSSSSNSLATPADSSAISTTAKRILDLIEEFSTPISEVNKMGNNLRATQQLFVKSNRLSDADLNSTRALRLSQIRTPYMRPKVTLQPSSKSLGQPPVRELQVPSMSQLVQMKKMQCSVERSRQIATQSGQQVASLKSVPEYSLPTETIDAGEHKQQIHSNKIKSKTNVARITSSKDVSKYDEAPPPPVNLPNIAFPLMHSVPKIDISLPTKSTLPVVAQTKTNSKSNDVTKNFSSVNSLGSLQNQEKNSEKTFSITKVVSTSAAANFKAGTEFEFSEPLTLNNVTDSPLSVIAINENFKFSPPELVQLNKETVSIPATQSQALSECKQSPQLKKGSVLDALKEPFKVPTTNSGKEQITTVTSASKYDLNFNSKFSKATNEWDCSTCFVRNKIENTKCVACETKKPSTLSSTQPEQITSFGPNSFGNQFKKSSIEWDCDICMVRNKHEVNKCVACETPRKETSAKNSLDTSASMTSKIPITNSFGDVFKPKVNTWECPTCLINNKFESNECVACQTKKPGSTFKLSTNTPLTTSAIPTTAIDAEFKSIAAQQKSSKWECDACMTHNDAARLKCVCCEQAKPGTQTVGDNAPKFSFGTSSTTKFNFGFGAMTNVTKEDNAQENKSVIAISTPAVPTIGTTPKTEPESKGFLFGNASASTGSSAFSFGFKPITSEPNKALTNNSKPSEVNSTPAGFKFGISSVNSTEGSAQIAPAIVSNSLETNKSSSSTTTSTVTFSLPTTKKAETDNSISSKEVTSAPTFSLSSTAPNTSNSSVSGGFSFGSIKTTSDNKNMSSISFTPTTNSTSSTNSFSFGVPATSTVNTTTTADTVSTTVKPLVNFSVPNSSSAAATTENNFSKPSSIGGFAFGSNSTLSPSTKLQLGSATSTSTTNAIANTTLTPPKTSGGILFQNSATAISTPVTTTIFGSTSNVTSTSTVSSTTTTPSTFSNINVFGTFGTPNDSSKSNNTAAFGAAATNATETKSFVFGSPKPITETNSGTSSNVPANNTTWPKSNFSFDPKATAVTTTTANQIVNDSSKAVFGSFGTAQTANANTGNSIFGNIMATASTPAPATATAALGNINSPITNIFATNSAPAAPTNATTTNIFGSSVSGNANTPAPASAFGIPIFGSATSSATNTFGSGTATSNTTFGNAAATSNTTFGSAAANSNTTFGSAAANSNTTFGSAAANSNTTFGSAAATSNTTFGSAAATSNTTFGSATALKNSTFGGGGVGGAIAQNTTFGSFGSAASNINTVDGASAAKKSEPAFSFGSSTTAGAGQSTSTSGGFNFGAAAGAVKPAFNFNASSQPTFNFTGAAELQTAKPFQFGAAPTAPVFNFSGGALEATPNAPFQFSAGIPPANNNIFAPAQTPGASASAPVRRKIRAPVRRITPR